MQSEVRVLRPMGYGELLDETLELYKSNFALVVAIAAIVYVPITVLQIAVYLALLAGQGGGRGEMIAGLAVAVVGLISLPFTIFMTGAMTKAVADRYLGQPSSVGAAYGFVLQQAWPLLFTVILATLLVIAGTMVCIVPGIIFAFWVAFVSPVFVVEGTSGWAAIQRSRSLVGGQWVRVLVLSFLAWIMIYIVAGAASGGLAVVLPETMRQVVNPALNGAVSIFLGPIPSIALILLYFDVRVRKEGFDLELLAQSLGPAPAAAAQSAPTAEGAQPPPRPQAIQPPAAPPEHPAQPQPPQPEQRTGHERQQQSELDTQQEGDQAPPRQE